MRSTSGRWVALAVAVTVAACTIGQKRKAVDVATASEETRREAFEATDHLRVVDERRQGRRYVTGVPDPRQLLGRGRQLRRPPSRVRSAPATPAALDLSARLRGLHRAMNGSAGTGCSPPLL